VRGSRRGADAASIGGHINRAEIVIERLKFQAHFLRDRVLRATTEGEARAPGGILPRRICRRQAFAGIGDVGLRRETRLAHRKTAGGEEQ
jgi:hypothetical protein